MQVLQVEKRTKKLGKGNVRCCDPREAIVGISSDSERRPTNTTAKFSPASGIERMMQRVSPNPKVTILTHAGYKTQASLFGDAVCTRPHGA